MFIIRWIIGRIILVLNFIFSPSSPKLTKAQQSALDEQLNHLSLYQLPACPFCVKVRRAMKRNGFNIELKNINQQSNYQDELIKYGGKRKVPCLRIANADGTDTWMYESSDIVAYLEQFSVKAA
ncbi:glutaredoxin family protein [Thalassotalea profundi]|uniref:Glutaredoxin n=1 Tax=Thalassotalea profundi TaxID=2036687 RepID=A0ABQ3IUE0_9GAMM|nr:glutaredoxin [Thalassotalea profundi]GHE92241.1 glutaredoxin [Thalassotalea profundi]